MGFKVVFTWYLEVLNILKGGWAKSSHSLKEGAQKVLPYVEGGGGAKCYRPVIFRFCCPPLPVINDKSLKPFPATCLILCVRHLAPHKHSERHTAQPTNEHPVVPLTLITLLLLPATPSVSHNNLMATIQP